VPKAGSHGVWRRSENDGAVRGYSLTWSRPAPFTVGVVTIHPLLTTIVVISCMPPPLLPPPASPPG
jgi:hypothetical protein